MTTHYVVNIDEIRLTTAGLFFIKHERERETYLLPFAATPARRTTPTFLPDPVGLSSRMKVLFTFASGGSRLTICDLISFWALITEDADVLLPGLPHTMQLRWPVALLRHS